MKLGFIGLGKMGAAMVERLLEAGHQVVAADLDKKALKRADKSGATAAGSLQELVGQLESPRLIWLMVPHGDPVDRVLDELQPLLEAGDIVIDGGNSHYKNSLQRAEQLAKTGNEFIDVGTSGGLAGARNGACLMIGAAEPAFQQAEPIFKSLAMPGGYTHMGPVGSGHYVKMVHNGVEYALVQAYGEGFELLKNSPFTYDLEQVANNWNHGSVVRSWILELAEQAFKDDPKLEQISDEIGGGSTGEWTLEAATDSKTPVPAIYSALAQRYATRRPESFTAKVVAALRQQWGGHEVKKK